MEIIFSKRARWLVMIALAGLVLLVVITVASLAGSTNWNESSREPLADDENEDPALVYIPASFGHFEASSNEGPSGLGWGTIGISDSKLGQYSKAAISADGVPCASVARNILSHNGTAADATIAALFCLGVVNTQSMGLGGGFLMTYYHAANSTAYVLDAREVAPRAATLDMYNGDGSMSIKGSLSIAVPGELRGYHALYRRFGGGVPWSELVKPAEELAELGHRVNWHMARGLRYSEEDILNSSSMSVFIDPSTGRVYREGDTLRRPALAATLRAIRQDPDALYEGALMGKLVQDLNKLGAIIDEQDLMDYRPRWRQPVQFSLANGGYTLYSVPPPGSGLLLGFLLNILDEFGLNPTSVMGDNNVLTHQRIVEALKYTYAKRTALGDEDYEDMKKLISDLSSDKLARYVASMLTETSTSQSPGYYGAEGSPPPNNHGTAHFSLLAENGDAVSVTSTINLYFGAKVRSEQTGIVFNDEMDDFSAPNITNYFGIPPSSANFIKPGKRPLSSMCPAIVVDQEGHVRLALGAAGGTKIPSGVASVVWHNLWLGKNLKQSIDARRLHHQLYPMTLMYEEGYNKTLIDELVKCGHRTQKFSVGGSVVCAVARQPGTHSGAPATLSANADFRKSGQVDGF